MRVRFLIAAVVATMTMTVNAHAGGQVYHLRGLINVFSYGMDAMAEKLHKRGVNASVHSHTEFNTLAAEATKLQKSGKGPIIIVGHSLGADACVYMAQKMKELGGQVALIVMYGPTIDLEIPSNVARVITYYQTSSALWRGKALKGPGFRGTINNINLDKAEDVTHFNIEKVDRLQNEAIQRIVALTGTGRPIKSPASSSARNSAPKASGPHAAF